MFTLNQVAIECGTDENVQKKRSVFLCFEYIIPVRVFVYVGRILTLYKNNHFQKSATFSYTFIWTGACSC